MEWVNIEHLLINSRQLLPFFPSRELMRCSTVSKVWMENVLIHLRTLPLRIGIDTDDINLKDEDVDLFHHLKQALRQRQQNPGAWLYPFIQLPLTQKGERVLLPYDVDRDCEVLHIRRNDTYICGTVSPIDKGRRTQTRGRFRVDADVKNVTIKDVCVNSNSWGVTIDEGCEVVLDGMVVTKAAEDGIFVTGVGTHCTIRNTIVSGCGGSGVLIEQGAHVSISGICSIRDNEEDAICVSNGAQLDLKLFGSEEEDEENESMIICNGVDGDGSRTYCVRSEGEGTMVRVFASKKECIGTTFSFEESSQNNKRNPFKKLYGGLISFQPKKKRKKKSKVHVPKKRNKKKPRTK